MKGNSMQGILTTAYWRPLIIFAALMIFPAWLAVATDVPAWLAVGPAVILGYWRTAESLVADMMQAADGGWSPRWSPRCLVVSGLVYLVAVDVWLLSQR